MDSLPTQRHLRVFLSYGSEDKDIVRMICSSLREDGVDAWFDECELLPGQDWNLEINRAVRRSDAILVCLSSRSVRKEGFLQKEIRIALDLAQEKPEGTIFIVPLKLDTCELPSRLQNWQWVDWPENDAYHRILRSLRARAAECKVDFIPGEGPIFPVPRPMDSSEVRTLYKTSDVQNIMRSYLEGKLLPTDVSTLSSEEIISISDEALSDLLSRFDKDDHRAQEKDTLLSLVGIRAPYHEWQEATTKNHCYRNSIDLEEEKTNMEWISVISTNLSSVRYDTVRGNLDILFLNGSIYRYFSVPERLFNGLLSAQSHGSYLNTYIKNAGYTYQKLR